MNVAAEPACAESADGNRSCLDVEGSKVRADLGADGVLVIRVCRADGTPVTVLVDEVVVADSRPLDRRPRGRHRKRQAPKPTA